MGHVNGCAQLCTMERRTLMGGMVQDGERVAEGTGRDESRPYGGLPNLVVNVYQHTLSGCMGRAFNDKKEGIVMQQHEKRLIEVNFPLRQTSMDSVHEKNVRHGHISTLHIWPARRPLAASRAALIATLL